MKYVTRCEAKRIEELRIRVDLHGNGGTRMTWIHSDFRGNDGPQRTRKERICADLIVVVV